MTGGDWLPTQAPFDLVRRGYSPQQVTEHLEQLEYDLRIATANRDATNQRVAELTNQLSAAQAEADSLRTQLDRNALEPFSVASLSDRMQRLIRLAEEEAAEIRATAAADAATQRERSEQDAAELRARTEAHVAEAEAAAESAAADLRARLAADREQLENERAEFAAERDRIRSAAEQQVRSLIDQANGFASTTRQQAEHQSQQQLSAAATEAERTVAAARAEATDTLSSANTEAERTLTQARTAAENLTATATAEADRTTADAQAAATEMVDTARTTAERLDRESATRRAQVDEDFEITIAGRRTEAYHVLAEREKQSVADARRRQDETTESVRQQLSDAAAEARRRIEEAAAEASRRVAEADAAVRDLTELRGRVLGQLGSLGRHLDEVRDLVGTAPTIIEPPEGEAGRVTAADFPPHPEGRPAPHHHAAPDPDVAADERHGGATAADHRRARSQTGSFELSADDVPRRSDRSANR